MQAAWQCHFVCGHTGKCTEHQLSIAYQSDKEKPERSESAQTKVVVIVLPVHRLAFVHFSMLVIQLR